MKLNLGVRLAVAAALTGAVPLVASANTITVTPPVDLTGNPSSTSATGSGLFVEAFDPALGKGFVEYLGPNWQSFAPSQVTPAGGVTMDFGIVQGTGTNTWATVFSGDTNPIDFVVMGVNSQATGAFSLEVTGKSTGLGTVRNSTVNAAVSNVSGAIASLPVVTGSGNPVVGLISTDAGNAFFNAVGTTLGNVFASGTVNGTAGGGAIDFWQATQVAGTPTATVKPLHYTNGSGAGQFTLSAQGDLQYSIPGGAVPLPAAVWLFGSGLLGLIGVGRRRVQQA
jgi:hypothetical protein